MQPKMYLFTVLCFWILATQALVAGGAPSTYFNIYVPPNNDPVQRNVSLIVTAIYDGTEFTITDDDADGDNDDTVTGTLAAGQSYVLYIKDNGINDDAQYASGGTLKRDGDYFIINSSKLVFASMSTDSDWQHDFVPSINKTSLGEKFIIYSPKNTNSLRDLNVFAFQDSTTITISKISTVPTTQTGYTNIDLEQKTVVRQRSINRGQDIIHYYQDGRDIMETGATYMIESNKPVSVQYGALWGNAKDGGGYVPSSNGSSSGELFYFAVPYQVNGEQEIRAVSWDDDNEVVLERYSNGNWVALKNWSADRLEPGDWIGRAEGNVSYPTVFRVSCTPGKKVSVFEANWMETGNPGTSDMASMLSSQFGTDTGKEFLAYLLPPGRQNNVVNPATGEFFGGNFSHCYLFAGNQETTVTIKDAKTNGAVINRTYTIAANRYADAYFSLEEWRSIYNGDGNPNSGSDRPYVLIESDENIAVMNANTNDNWMLYFGSSLPSSFTQVGSTSQSMGIPGDSISYVSVIENGPAALMNPELVVTVGSGGRPYSSVINIGGTIIEGVITITETGTTITYSGLPNLAPGQEATVTTDFVMSPSYNNGSPMPVNTIISVESAVTGESEGQLQQSLVSGGVQNISDDYSNLIYTKCMTGPMVSQITDSWNSAWIDYNNDGWDDLFITNRDPNAPNQFYQNNGDGSFTQITAGPLVNNSEKTIASAWGDFNNDGFVDVLIINATGTKSRLFKNTAGIFTEVANANLDTNPQYFHGAAWLDMDNDGFLDLIITNYFETNFHQMYRNNGDETFTRITDNPIVLESNRSTMPALSDFNNDGLIDVFIPNGQNQANSLFKNLGNGRFEKVTDAGTIITDQANSVGAAWGDYNNDGLMDIFVLNASKQANQLYKNLGEGIFTEVTNTKLTNPLGDTHSAVWLDHDNDGDLDIFIANDDGPSYYYINNGDETFTAKEDELLASKIVNAMGASTSDYDKDGNPDLFVTTHSAQDNAMYCNQLENSNNYLNIKLVGINSNKSGIGAKIEVVSGSQSQFREVLPVQGLGSQNSLRQHFGLGQAATVSTIEVTWPSGYVQTVNNISANQFITITEEAANLIEGLAFSDDNDNCQWDEGEAKVENIQFSFGENSSMFTSRKEGEYGIRVGAGNHAIEAVENDFWTLNCAANVTFDGVNNTEVIDLPLKKKINATDLGIGFGITAWRRGFTNESVLSYYNQGTVNSENNVISLTYPAGVELVSASIPWTENTGNTYTWDIAEIPAGQEFTLQLIDSVTLEVMVGDTLPVAASISTTTSETDLTNNTYNEEMEVVGAIDPNDLLVTPRGKGREGFIPKDQVIKYHIRFQNVGTYYASRVVLDNQLSSNLDWTTFKIESVSHERYNYSINQNGLLSVRFDDIMLLDSTTNEAESHGFFIYTIKPKNDINGGARIDNKVLITFDYEEPIVTNTVVNTIKYSSRPEVGNLIMFPNPTSGMVNILADSDANIQAIPLMHTVKIVNALGAVVMEIHNEDEYQVTGYVNQLITGVYSVIGYDYEGKVYHGKLVKL